MRVPSESWYKVSLPAFPVAFTLAGVWLYWGENPVALLPSPVAFWGLVVLFYLFTHLYVPNKRYPLLLTISATLLWLIASITSHNLGKFLISGRYSGPASVLANKDFWYSYVSAGVGCLIGLRNFFRFEPVIAGKSLEDRSAADAES